MYYHAPLCSHREITDIQNNQREKKKKNVCALKFNLFETVRADFFVPGSQKPKMNLSVQKHR